LELTLSVDPTARYRVVEPLFFNDDVIEGESGFPMHPHREMEIVTLVQGGELTHYDSVGNHGSIRPGDVQKMSAGTGIQLFARDRLAVHQLLRALLFHAG